MALVHERLETAQPELPAAPERLPSLWHNRDYMLLWSGQLVSNLGSQVSRLAFPLLILALTHSPAQAGLLAAAQGLPFFFLSLPFGALVDRWDRKRAMLVADLGRAVALCSLPVAYELGHLVLLQLYLVALLVGTLDTCYNLAEAACLPRVVPHEQLPDALAQNEGMYSVSTMVGPSIGGILFGLGNTVPFLADALSYLVSGLSLRCIGVEFQGERDRPSASLWAEIGEGLSWLRHHALIRFLALLTCGMTLLSSGYSIILIVFAQQQHASPFVIGLIFASDGMGSVIGALLAGRLLRRYGFTRVLITATWLWALSWPCYVLAPNLVWLGAINAIGFIVVPIYMIAHYSYRLQSVPDALQGRVNSAFKLIAYGAQPLGLALTGVLVGAIGPVSTTLLYTPPLLIMATLATINPHIHRVRTGAR